MHPPERSSRPAILPLRRNRYSRSHSKAIAFVLLASVSMSCAAAPGTRSTSRLGSATTTSVLPSGDQAGNQLSVKPIVFPVSGGARYSDTFGAPRSGGRTHEGQDLIESKGTPLVAAVSGRVTRLRHELSGLSGNSLTITADDGWSYVFNCHFNTAHPDLNLNIGEHSDNLAEFNIDYGDCFCTIERMKKKANDGTVLYEVS